MLKHPYYTAIFATLYLLVFVLILQFKAWTNLIDLLFFLSPLIVLALVWSILRHSNYRGQELSKDEQWGYQDKLYKKS